MSELSVLWQVHQGAGWPRGAGPNEGELMTLDTVIGGCVTYYLESPEGLDPQRLRILQDCMDELADLMPDVGEEAAEYFERLHALGRLLLDCGRP
jgi:hypothetical protein